MAAPNTSQNEIRHRTAAGAQNEQSTEPVAQNEQDSQSNEQNSELKDHASREQQIRNMEELRELIRSARGSQRRKWDAYVIIFLLIVIVFVLKAEYNIDLVTWFIQQLKDALDPGPIQRRK
eukprot:TRINITY_DN5273_c0_g1_i2.p1 TRINITY_DN5273_c0_g1~~TRINITY_DN5273_c0_g1_i2.p1  ORF type:complete len:133 (-),score=37.44 TRINITY_DN5273_c0_g1_i2:289-651(-)